jgi:hypothetical protein
LGVHRNNRVANEVLKALISAIVLTAKQSQGGLWKHLKLSQPVPPVAGSTDGWRRSSLLALKPNRAEYDREHGHNPIPHPRGDEVYVLVPAERLEEALKILKASEGSRQVK